MAKAKADPPETSVVDAEDILETLLDTARVRADYLRRLARRTPAKFKHAYELQSLIGAVAHAVDLDNRWLAKLDPLKLQEKLAARAAAAGGGVVDA